MNFDKRSRGELKSYFVKDAVPTESQFAELIDGMLNQKDDGLTRLPGKPLAIQAAGEAGSAKGVLELYQDFTEKAPDWTLGLRSSAAGAGPEGGRRGLSIAGPDGKSRLFIDHGTGHVGLGNVAPAAALHVSGGARIDGDLEVRGLVRPALPWVDLPGTEHFNADPENRSVPACCKDAHGFVKLRGSFKSTATYGANEVMTTLAPGYRPVEKKLFIVALLTTTQVAAGMTWVEIGPTGELTLLAGVPQGRYLALDGISFDAAPA